jgi:glycosyltransferase involved in cell wall biosynthesis
MKPLVSILIPAYNAEAWIASTLRSAVGQTWPCKEVIVIDDGSTDRTAEVARWFASTNVAILSKQNEGAAAARNDALRVSQGDYIQWLDADDLLAPDKIEKQLAALRDEADDNRTLLSCAWANFDDRVEHATFVPTPLWRDLSPVEWLTRRMSEDLYMQTATWLTSRELTDAAGPWNPRLLSDDDVEYFCRVLLASKGTRFVPEAKVFYRNTPSLSRLSYIGASNAKRDALALSLKLQLQHLLSVDDGECSRRACLAHLQHSSAHFYPERPDIFAELQTLAATLHGRLETPFSPCDSPRFARS